MRFYKEGTFCAGDKEKQEGNNLKKQLMLLVIMAAVTLAGAGITVVCSQPQVKQEKEVLTVVTSFYPVYIAAENILEGVSNVELVNLTENQGGCLHDYQLTTADMRKLEHADVLIINGGGMESFIGEVMKAYPQTVVIDAGEGISMLEAEDHDHEAGDADEEEHEDHNHGSLNAHVWMDPDRYIQQLKNITEGLIAVDGENRQRYLENCDDYIKKVEPLSRELKELDAGRLKQGIISFHDAFAYLADTLSIPVIHSIELDKDTYLSAGEVAEVIEDIRENHISYIFSEEQLSESSPLRVAEETGAKLCIIDSLVSGSVDKDAYLTGMQNNIKMMKQVLADEK